jgi:hypothetical protein
MFPMPQDRPMTMELAMPRELGTISWAMAAVMGMVAFTAAVPRTKKRMAVHPPDSPALRRGRGRRPP